MPVKQVRGVNIHYRVIGEDGPWVTLTTGGRRGFSEFVPLAVRIAGHGFRVLLHDRRNTGASDVLVEGDDGEEEIWADDLHALLRDLDALPAFIGGSSSGARMSILYGLRHPETVRGLLLFRVTGGSFAAGVLPDKYYGQFIQAAQSGGMKAVCATEEYRERITSNPANRDRLMAMDPDQFIGVQQRWLDRFSQDLDAPVMGVSEADLSALACPVIVIPGNDKVHSSVAGGHAHRLIPGAQLHELPIEDEDVDLIPFEDWAPLEDEIATAFAGFMGRVLADE